MIDLDLYENTFYGFLADGTVKENLSNEILSREINKTAHIYDIINLDQNRLKLNWCNSIKTKMSLMTIQKNEFFN